MNINRQNNNNNNNRRRGRGNNNNRPQNNNRNNGFDYQNRIDNRARGNASQMLEKYKKLASDAQHNDDRVNAEYYLQFADHYFRVLADFRGRQEARQEPRQDDNRRDRNENRDDWQDNDQQGGNYEEQDTAETSESEDGDAVEAEAEVRAPRNNDRPRRERNDRAERAPRAPRRHHSEEAADETASESGLDLILPPSIGITPDVEEEQAVKPARKPRARRAAPSANNDDVVDAAE